MPKKRRNNGRNRHGRGHTRLVDCSHCMCKPAKDKAIGRFMVRNMVDAGALNDLRAASAFEREFDMQIFAESVFVQQGFSSDHPSSPLPPVLSMPSSYLQSTCCPSCTPRTTTACLAPCTPALCACATWRSAASVSPRCASGARRTVRRRRPLKREGRIAMGGLSV